MTFLNLLRVLCFSPKPKHFSKSHMGHPAEVLLPRCVLKAQEVTTWLMLNRFVAGLPENYMHASLDPMIEERRDIPVSVIK